MLCAVPGVLGAAVVGRPDPVFGEVPVAFVSVYPDADVTETAVLDHCATHRTRVKVPESITVLDALPKNPVGKVDKPNLRGSARPAALATVVTKEN